MTDLHPGDFLIPDITRFSYCLRVDKVTPWHEGCWWKQGWTHTLSTRFDLDKHGCPKLTNPSTNKKIRLLRQIRPFEYEDYNDGDILTKFIKQTELF